MSMNQKRMETARVVSQEQLADQIYSLWLETEEIAAQSRCGQFVLLYCREGSRLLPRPISICETAREKGRLRLVYRVTGAHTGTEEFSRLKKGDTIRIMGPLGNGFPMEVTEGKKVLLIGGGIGIPPLLETARELHGQAQAVLGYRQEAFLMKEFAAVGRVFAASEDGKTGTRGTVLDAIRENRPEADLIFACGPAPMLRAVKAFALEREIPCWISMEERMACGIGACLGCVCQSVGEDAHSRVHNKRVCKEGPVFLSTEVKV